MRLFCRIEEQETRGCMAEVVGRRRLGRVWWARFTEAPYPCYETPRWWLLVRFEGGMWEWVPSAAYFQQEDGSLLRLI